MSGVELTRSGTGDALVRRTRVSGHNQNKDTSFSEEQHFRQQSHQDDFQQQTPSRGSVLDFLTEQEQHYPVFRRLCFYLGIAEIIALTRTCRKLSSLYRQILKFEWNILPRLRRFVDNPEGLLSKLGQCEALISGSFALQFFERVTWRESDLDLFVRDGNGAEDLCEYLENVEKCELVSINDNESYSMVDLVVTQTYTRLSNLDGSSCKIQVVRTEFIPVQAILRGFYTSAVINFISWNKAYSMFPSPTFIDHKTYLTRKPDDYLGGLLAKYSERGWRSQEVLWPEEEKSSHPIQRSRRVADRLSWIIPLDVRNVSWSRTPDSALEYATFSIAKCRSLPDPIDRHFHYEIAASAFTSMALKHGYTHTDCSDFFLTFAAERLSSLLFLECLKINPAERPAFHFPSQLRGGGLASYPQTWRFCDDQIPKWYEAWEKMKLSNPDEQSWVPKIIDE
ncbi:hypothetical protein MMC11_005890 [Xylographa trunciseda]|nr:hypothetical protein [Xylographa trunciseda]